MNRTLKRLYSLNKRSVNGNSSTNSTLSIALRRIGITFVGGYTIYNLSTSLNNSFKASIFSNTPFLSNPKIQSFHHIIEECGFEYTNHTIPDTCEQDLNCESDHLNTEKSFIDTIFNSKEDLLWPIEYLFTGIKYGLLQPLYDRLNNNSDGNVCDNKNMKIRLGGGILGGDNTAMCCGIVGYMGSKEAVKCLLEGVFILQNRGYDSCGISTLDDDNNICTTKFASGSIEGDCIEKLSCVANKNHAKHTVGIAHTRWATHGAKVDRNAHPQNDYKGRLSLVHNGIIDNYQPLKSMLMSHNIPFSSDTDTEVIANLISFYMEKYSLEIAVRKAISELEGTWGLLILPSVKKNEDRKMILATHGSPLVIGKSLDGNLHVSSEGSAMSVFTNEFVPLDDSSVLVIDSTSISSLFSRDLVHKSSYKIDKLLTPPKSPHPFTHWTKKEIFEQSESLRRSFNYGGRLGQSFRSVKLGGLEKQRDQLLSLDSLFFTACGSSYYAALFANFFFQRLNIFETTQVLDACEFHPYSLPSYAKANPILNYNSEVMINDKTNGVHTQNKKKIGMIFISQSGETLDTIDACKQATPFLTSKISIVNVVGSYLARYCGCGVYLNAGFECGVASTKSFSSQVSVLSMIALWLYIHKQNLSVPISPSVKPDYSSPLYEAGVHLPALSLNDVSEEKKEAFDEEEVITNTNGSTYIGKDVLKIHNTSSSNYNTPNLSRKIISVTTASSSDNNTSNGYSSDSTNNVKKKNKSSTTIIKGKKNVLGEWGVESVLHTVIADNDLYGEEEYDGLQLCESMHRSLCVIPSTIENYIHMFDKSSYDLAQELVHTQSIFILGSGSCYPIALEASLKIKELAYIHSEGFSGGALKHGPFAMIDEAENTPVIILMHDKNKLSLMKSAAQQVKTRGAYLVILTSNMQNIEKNITNKPIHIPNIGVFTPLLMNIYLQLLAYNLAILKKSNPDKPRGLAKTVTVH